MPQDETSGEARLSVGEDGVEPATAFVGRFATIPGSWADFAARLRALATAWRAVPSPEAFQNALKAEELASEAEYFQASNMEDLEDRRCTVLGWEEDEARTIAVRRLIDSGQF